MNLEEKRRVLKRLMAAIRTSKAPKHQKEIAIKDMRKMLKDDDYCNHVTDGYENPSRIIDSFNWSKTDSYMTPDFSWSRMDDYVDNVLLVRVGNYSVHIFRTHIEVGCQTVTWEQWKNLKKAVHKSGYLKRA